MEDTRNFQPPRSLLLFLSPPPPPRPPRLFLGNAARSSALFSSFPLSLSPVRIPLIPTSLILLLFFSPTPRRPPSCSCIFCCLLQPRTTARRAGQFHRGPGVRASPSRRAVATGNSPLRPRKSRPPGMSGDGGGRVVAEGGGGSAGTTRVWVARGREGGRGRRGGKGREGGWGGRVVRTLCQELSASGKNSIPRLKGMTRSLQGRTAEAVIFARAFVCLCAFLSLSLFISATSFSACP